MSPNQSLVVVVRLFALWLIGYYITTAPSLYVQAKKFSPDPALVYSLGAAAVVLAFSAALWYSASWLAQRLISGPSQGAERSAAFDSWFSVGCALIGLWVLAKAIPALLHYFIANFMGAGMFPNTYIVTPEWVGSHFIWKMVRRIVGVLVEVGTGNKTEKDILNYLNVKSNEVAKFTSPPSGLFLEKVLYESERLTDEFYSIIKI